MKKVIPLLLAAALTACGPKETRQKATPKRMSRALKNWRPIPCVSRNCASSARRIAPQLGDELCNRVAEATRKRFYGDGKTPYTPPENPPKF